MNNGIDIWQSGTWLSGTNLFESNDTGINIGTGGKLSFNKDSSTTISESKIGLHSGQADVKLAGVITKSTVLLLVLCIIFFTCPTIVPSASDTCDELVAVVTKDINFRVKCESITLSLCLL